MALPPRFELHLVKDIASWRYGGRTACLGSYRDRDAARRALDVALRERPHCSSAYEIHEVSA